MKILLIIVSSVILFVCLFMFFSCGSDKKTELPSESKSEMSGAKEETHEKADVDLSVLSGTMVYAEVYRIMSSPTDYVGKTMKVKGTYKASYYAPTQKYYSYVVVADATACCAQGFEFEWVGKTYPEDYPKEGEKIEVVGVFGSYNELGTTYYSLTVDSLKIL